MRIFFLGDIVGRGARLAALAQLPALRQEFTADFMIVNVENSAGGFGVTPDIADGFFTAGADVLTTGNHVWDKREIFDYIRDERRLLRPLNMAEGVPGAGYIIAENQKGQKLAVANFIANLFMGENENLFVAQDAFLRQIQLGRDADAIFIDLHGEATSEKNAFGLAADGLVSAVIGTHTHIPTADHRILPNGTAYQTDVGMCGDYTSVIGMQPEAALGRFRGKAQGRLEVAKGEPTLCGIIIDTDDKTGLATSVTAFRRGGVLSCTC